MRAVSSLAVVSLLAGSARAQPAEDKDPTAALYLSGVLGLAGAGLIAGGVTDSRDGGGLVLIGAVVSTFGPSAGHWYAGETVTAGLGLRLLGDGLIALGASRDLSCNCDRRGEPLALAGAALLGFGVVYDVATAPGAAERYNRAHGAHVTVAPAAIPSATGVIPAISIGGTF